MDREGYNLIIIDTFSRILGRGDQMDQQEMTRTMGALQRLAAEHGAAILLVDHHRKSARTTLDADPIDDIMGSTAKAGVVDCAMGLYRRHNQNEARLKLSGRDFGDSELALEWDPEAFCWNLKQGAAGAKGHLHPARARGHRRGRRAGARHAQPARRASRPGQEQPVQPAAEACASAAPWRAAKAQEATNIPSCRPSPQPHRPRPCSRL